MKVESIKEGQYFKCGELNSSYVGIYRVTEIKDGNVFFEVVEAPEAWAKEWYTHARELIDRLSYNMEHLPNYEKVRKIKKEVESWLG